MAIWTKTPVADARTALGLPVGAPPGPLDQLWDAIIAPGTGILSVKNGKVSADAVAKLVASPELARVRTAVTAVAPAPTMTIPDALTALKAVMAAGGAKVSKTSVASGVGVAAAAVALYMLLAPGGWYGSSKAGNVDPAAIVQLQDHVKAIEGWKTVLETHVNGIESSVDAKLTTEHGKIIGELAAAIVASEQKTTKMIEEGDSKTLAAAIAAAEAKIQESEGRTNARVNGLETKIDGGFKSLTEAIEALKSANPAGATSRSGGQSKGPSLAADAADDDEDSDDAVVVQPVVPAPKPQQKAGKGKAAAHRGAPAAHATGNADLTARLGVNSVSTRVDGIMERVTAVEGTLGCVSTPKTAPVSQGTKQQFEALCCQLYNMEQDCSDNRSVMSSIIVTEMPKYVGLSDAEAEWALRLFESKTSPAAAGRRRSDLKAARAKSSN